MTSINLVRSELRKLTTTRMPLAFLAVLVVLAVTNGIAVAVGTDMDGSKTFISTAADQQSLMAFAANALMIAGLFGAIAAAREYANNTVIATYLSAPRRSRALSAQLAAVGLGGAILGFIGAGAHGRRRRRLASAHRSTDSWSRRAASPRSLPPPPWRVRAGPCSVPVSAPSSATPAARSPAPWSCSSSRRQSSCNSPTARHRGCPTPSPTWPPVSPMAPASRPPSRPSPCWALIPALIALWVVQRQDVV